jgi:circadian clock protein KaiC
MLRGGFMRGDAVMVAGRAGTGKTTIALQHLVNGAASFDEPGVYVTFEEMPDQLYRDALSFGWGLRQLEKENKIRVVCTSPKLLLSDEGTSEILAGPIKEIKASSRRAVDVVARFRKLNISAIEAILQAHAVGNSV